ncbi:MAG: Bug family tripartite tricarboxylate transporter substrate binding protein [Pigmentiphaga sp.]
MATAACTATLLSPLTTFAANEAEQFPSKPIRLIVPYAVGGATDLIGRTIAHILTEDWGESVVVENRPGGAGITSANAVANASPDGYTLLLSDIQQLAINPFLFDSLSYDPEVDFTPVSLFSTMPLFMMVNADLPIHTLKDLVEYCKKNPGKIVYSTPGLGTIHHIAMETFKSRAGADMLHVPYRGTAQALSAFISGDVQVVPSTFQSFIPFIESGKGRLIAVTSLERDRLAPDVAPVADLLPNYAFTSDVGLVAPKGTSKAVTEKIATT